MKTSDQTRLAKLLSMTTSSNDNEALLAARKANALLQKLGMSWEGIVCPTVDQDNVAQPVPHHAEAQHLLQAGKGIIDAFERRFLIGIMGFKNLSDKQQATLDGIKRKVTARSS